ncbi:MAG: hypothetical protein R3351_02495 [Nitrospirales bacterium]|nr:hypothetical protein [Nitrospirales bacterium]
MEVKKGLEEVQGFEEVERMDGADEVKELARFFRRKKIKVATRVNTEKTVPPTTGTKSIPVNRSNSDIRGGFLFTRGATRKWSV